MVTNVNLSTRKIVGYRSLKPNCVKPGEQMIYSRRPLVFSAAIQTIIDESVFNDNYGVLCMQMTLAVRGPKLVYTGSDGSCSKCD